MIYCPFIQRFKSAARPDRWPRRGVKLALRLKQMLLVTQTRCHAARGLRLRLEQIFQPSFSAEMAILFGTQPVSQTVRRQFDVAVSQDGILC